MPPLLFREEEGEAVTEEGRRHQCRPQGQPLMTLHSFQHQFATRALGAGVPVHLQAIGGRKSAVMLQRYGKGGQQVRRLSFTAQSA